MAYYIPSYKTDESKSFITSRQGITKEEILDKIKYYAEFEENHAGVKGDVVWDSDFEALAEDIVKLLDENR